MSNFIDHIIFGNGYGLASPSCNRAYFWLDGRMYNFMGGFGAQLTSKEWRKPEFKERRKLAGLEFEVFNYSRRWFKYDVSWGLTTYNATTNEDIAKLRKKLIEMV